MWGVSGLGRLGVGGGGGEKTFGFFEDALDGAAAAAAGHLHVEGVVVFPGGFGVGHGWDLGDWRVGGGKLGFYELGRLEERGLWDRRKSVMMQVGAGRWWGRRRVGVETMGLISFFCFFCVLVMLFFSELPLSFGLEHPPPHLPGLPFEFVEKNLFACR